MDKYVENYPEGSEEGHPSDIGRSRKFRIYGSCVVMLRPVRRKRRVCPSQCLPFLLPSTHI